jgi:hypothetical protein
MPSQKQMEQERKRMNDQKDFARDWQALAGDFRKAHGNLPAFAPGIADEQHRLERESELAAREDYDEPPTAWDTGAAFGLFLLGVAGFVGLVLLVVKILRAHAGWPLLVVLAVASALGCARMQPATVPSPPVTIPAAPRSPQVLVLSEKVGSTVAEIIESATGQRPFAVAAPGLPIIVFSPKDATDPGLIAHELCHQRQQADMGPLRWSAVYVRDLAECERIVARATCLKSVPLEAECYWIQRGVPPTGGAR